MRKILYSLFTICASSFGSSVLAQDGLFSIQMDATRFQSLNTNIIQVGGVVRDAQMEPQRVDKSDVISPSSLYYKPSEQRRRQNLLSFARRAESLDPSGSSKFAQLLRTTDLIEQLNQTLRPVGMHVDNVADSYALWWVAAWEAVNQRDAGTGEAMYNSVKQQASAILLSTRQFESATDAVKQETAEALLIQAALIDAHIDAAAGNPSQQAALAKAVNQGAKKMGLDLTTMDLTEQGFVPRSGKRSDAGSGDTDTALAANDNGGDTSKLALYGVGGVALLAGMFALGKSFGGKG